VSFCQQVKALIWKNYILKRRHWKMALIELVMPLVYCVVFLATIGAFSKKDSTLDNYLRHEFYTFVQYLGLLPLLFVSFGMFINFQIPREKAINLDSSLIIMNVSPVASEVSIMIIQQVTALLLMMAAGLVQISYLLLSNNLENNTAKNKFLVLLTVLCIEMMIVISILTSRLSGRSLLISTQIGQLV
jgi:hypothetical protein